MKTITKALVGTVAAGAMAMASAVPAQARDNRHDNGIDAGDVIAGALIIGGIAALAGAFDGDHNDRHYRDGRYRDYDGRGYNKRYNNYRGGNSRSAVDRCVRAVERDASRYTRGRADVTQIRDIDRKSYGYRIKGRLQVEERGRYNRGYDTGRFTCTVRNGRVADIDYSGIRGLR